MLHAISFYLALMGLVYAHRVNSSKRKSRILFDDIKIGLITFGDSYKHIHTYKSLSLSIYIYTYKCVLMCIYAYEYQNIHIVLSLVTFIIRLIYEIKFLKRR